MSNFKGTNTTTQTTAPNPAAAAAYQQLLNQAGSVASTPYQAYQGQLVAPVNAQQNLGIGGVNQYANFAQPYISQAAGYATQAAQPIGAAQIQQYESPYTQQVVNATEQQFNNQNAQQQQQVLGNAVSQGALGGDRVSVAQSVLAGQQQAAQAPVIAGLENTGYQQALQEANVQQQNQANAAYSLGNLGVAGQQAGISGAGSQIGAGTLEQQTQQAQNQAAYGQFEQALAYPFQTTQWLAGIDTGVGSQLGGTSTTQGPPPNPLTQLAGLGLGAFGVLGGTGAFGSSGYLNPNNPKSIFSADGGRVEGYDNGGSVAPYSAGSMPYGVGAGWIPAANITRGQGAPRPPQAPQQGGAAQMFSDASKLANAFRSNLSNTKPGVGIDETPLPGEEGISDNAIYRRGGHVPIRGAMGLSSFLPHRARGGLADDGTPASFDARWPTDQIDESPRIINDAPIGVASPVATIPEAQQDAEEAPLAYAGVAPTDAAPFSGSVAETPRGSEEAAQTGLSPDFYTALTAAGLGMLSSRSPFLGVGIGEGGLQGLSTYSNLQQQRQTQANKQQDIDLRVRQLDQQAKAEQDRIAQANRPYSEMTAAQKAELAQKNIQMNRPIKMEDSHGRQYLADPLTGREIGAATPAQPNAGFINPMTGAPFPPQNVPPAAPNTPTAPASAIPSSPVNTAFGDTEDAALPLRAILNSAEIPPGLNPAALDDPNLTPGDRARVKAIGEGRAAFLPLGRGNKENQYIMQKAYEYNPNLDQTMYGRRQKTENFFAVGTAGGGGQQVIALNRFAAHAGSLLKLAEGLDEGQYPTWNSFRNAASRSGFGWALGDKKEMQDTLGAWDVNAKGVGDEASKVFAGKDPAFGDRQTWEHILQPDTPLSTIKAKLRQAVTMAYGALEANTATYNEGMRTNHLPREFMTPHTRQIFDAIENNRPINDAITGAAGAQPQGSGSAANDPLSEARAAIQAGKPRDLVIKRLREHGIDPTGL